MKTATYTGSARALRLRVGGKGLRLPAGEAVEVTEAQAKALSSLDEVKIDNNTTAGNAGSEEG